MSREASNAIKGLLILLIVLGHNSILCSEWVDGKIASRSFLYTWLYTFHVYCFFILPFMYGRTAYKKGNIAKNAKRLLWPYTWIFAVCLVISLVAVKENPFNLPLLSWAYVSGSWEMMDKTISLNFPWFLPTIFTLLLLKDLFYTIGKRGKIVLLTASMVYWLLAIANVLNFATVANYTPFALAQAFRMLPICLLVVWCVRSFNTITPPQQVADYQSVLCGINSVSHGYIV